MTGDQWLRRWFDEIWNKGRAEAIEELLAEDAVIHGLTKDGNPPPARPLFKAFWERFRGAFSGIHIAVDETIVEGNRAVARITFTGTHTGDGLGVAPTGRSVKVTGMCVVHLRDGQVVEGWNEFDFASLLQQIQVDPNAHALRA